MRGIGDNRSRAVAAAAILASLLRALGAAAGVVGDACAGPAPALTAVRLSANAWIDERGLRRIAGLDEPGVWTAERAAEVRHRLMRTEVFRAVEFALEDEEGSCRLAVKLDRRPIVSRVHLSGAAQPRWAPLRAAWRWVTGDEDRAPPPTDREVRRMLRLRPGTLFDEASLDRSSERIVARYHHAGYPSARVMTAARERDGAVEVDVVIRPGRPLLVTEVESAVDKAAARRVVDAVLQSRLGLAKSRYLVRDTRRLLARRLREAGFFEVHIAVHWRAIDAERGALLAEVGAGRQRRIDVIGNDSVGSAALLDLERLYGRTFVTNNTWRQMARAMREEYHRRGFAHARVEVDSDGDEAIVFRVTEGERYKVAAVWFEGNATLSSRELREVVATGQRSWLGPVRPPRAVESVLGDDVARIREHYERSGFASAAVARRLTVDRNAGTIDVTFSIQEGVRTYLRSVAWEEAVEHLTDAMPPQLAIGLPLDVAGIESERTRMLLQLRGAGYRDAQIDYAIERVAAGDGVDAHLVWQVAPGPLHRHGEAFVRGNAEVQYVVVTRDLPFAEGDPIEAEALLNAQQAVQESGVFHNVSIQPVVAPESQVATAEDDRKSEETTALGDEDDESPNSAAQRDTLAADDEEEAGGAAVAADDGGEFFPLDVSVAARAPGRMAYGVGYDTRQGVTGFAEVSYGNVNHRAQRLRLRGQVGFDPGESDEPTQYLVTAGFTEPRVFDGPWDFHLNGLAERNTRTVNQFNIERGSAVIGSSRRLNRRVRAGSDLQAEFARVFDVVPVPFLDRDQRDAWTTSISPFIVYDGRDSVFDPRSGFFESLRLRYAIPGASTTDFVEISAQHAHFIPLWRDWNFVYSLRAGWVHSLDAEPVMPIRQRYFIGGGESVRGFDVNTLGPYDGNGADVGGDLAIVVKSELRIPLIGGLGWVLFVDGGGNYLIGCDSACRAGDPADPATAVRDAAFTLDNFRPTAGMGIRYVTPVGPISLDYGIKLDRRDRLLADGTSARESFGAFSVSVGARF